MHTSHEGALTKLTKPVRREVETPAGRTLIVTLTPEGVLYREKRRRTSYLLPHGLAFIDAVRLKAAEKVVRRRVRRGLLHV